MSRDIHHRSTDPLVTPITERPATSLRERLHNLIEELRAQREQIDRLTGMLARRDAEIEKLRLRVLSVASGNVTICERCLSDVESSNLRAMLQENAAEIRQLRALVAARPRDAILDSTPGAAT